MVPWWWLIPAFYAGVFLGAWVVMWCRERAEESDAELRTLDERNLQRWGHG